MWVSSIGYTDSFLTLIKNFSYVNLTNCNHWAKSLFYLFKESHRITLSAMDVLYYHKKLWFLNPPALPYFHLLTLHF